MGPRSQGGHLGIITTVAGDGTHHGFTGDGGLATNAYLESPGDVAVDATGSLFITDTSRTHSIRKVDPLGFITTVAVEGKLVFRGDGDIAVDGAGNLFVVDRGNRIIKVEPSGVITTVAGNGENGFGGDGGPAVSASFQWISGVALDAAGNLYIADRGNCRIREVDTSGIITTVAGNGDYRFSGDDGPAVDASLDNPRRVVVDADGNLFIADAGNYRIRKVDASGMITTVAGNGERGFSGDGGAATEASFHTISDVAVDAAGSLFVADSASHRIRRVVFDVEPSGEGGTQPETVSDAEIEALEATLATGDMSTLGGLIANREAILPVVLAAQKRSPENPKWVGLIEFFFAADGSEARDLPPEERRASYETSLAYLEAYASAIEAESPALSVIAEERAFASLEVGKLEAAQGLAKDALATNTDTASHDYGNVIHWAKTILGRVALRQNDLDGAKRYLAESGKTPGSGTLDTFGPSFILARELLEKGETSAVLQYLDLVAEFWVDPEKDERMAQMHGDMLEKWKREINAGRVPQDRKWR